MKKLLVMILLLGIVCGCGKKANKELEKVMKENNYIIVDVRTKKEYETEHVSGAINIPYDEIQNNWLDKNKTIIVYCQSGKRSGIAYNKLKSLGFDVLDLGAYDSITLKKES